MKSFHRYSFLFALSLAAAACGGTTSSGDAGTDVVSDTSTTDVITPTDVPSSDVPASDVPTTTDTAPVDAAEDVVAPSDAGCSFSGTYTYGNSGGHTPVSETSSIAPVTTWTRTRTIAGGTTLMCMQSVACGTSGLLSVQAVEAAIANADVQAALNAGNSPVFGLDSRPVDGSVWMFTRTSDGHDFAVGGDCGGTAGCTPIPAGIASLRTMMQNLDSQELAMSGCEALR